MSKVRTVLAWCIPMVLIAVALMAPAIAQAGSIKIWPDQLKPMEGNGEYEQSVHVVMNGAFTAPFTLPAGARITKITYYHYAETSPASTWLVIFRVKMGNMPEQLGSGTSTDFGGTIIPVEVELTGDSVIRAGYRYSILVNASNANS